MAIHLRSADEIGKMHRAGLIVHEVLNALRASVRPGMTTMDLEKLAEEKIAGKPGHPAFKGYRGYPCVLCTSVNSEIVHGIPSPKRKLKEGDIVSIDLVMEVDGCFAVSAVTVPRLSMRALHVGEQRDRSRDSVAEAKVEGRRHRLHRLRDGSGRVLRGFSGNCAGWQDQTGTAKTAGRNP